MVVVVVEQQLLKTTNTHSCNVQFANTENPLPSTAVSTTNNQEQQ